LKYIYECIDRLDSFNLYKNIILKRKVFIVEPFYTYHHRGNNRFCPPPLPSWTEELINTGKAVLISAKDLNTQDIYLLSAEKAVDAVEDVYPAYRKRFAQLFSFISSCLCSQDAENAFRITLCNNLAEFYSTNILLHRIEALFKNEPICFFPAMNVRSYLFSRQLLIESGKDFHHHESVSFSAKSRFKGKACHLKNNLILIMKLCVQVLASGIVGKKNDKSTTEKKLFSFGISITGSRQLRDNQRSPNFMLGEMAHNSKVVYFPLLPLTESQEKKLREFSGVVLPVPRPGKFYTNFADWKKLLLIGLRHQLTKTSDELYTAVLTLYNYLAWNLLLNKCSVKHFITHADFGIPQVGRNIALNQAGSQTWYFTDSINHVCFFQNPESKGRHPFWTYLNYDHFVTWTRSLAEYYKLHPGSVKKTHVVGCLWSEHIRDKREARRNSFLKDYVKTNNDSFIICCFDTTYTHNGFTNYYEGLRYAEHLFRLVEDTPKVFLIFKEKKDRNIHFTFDPESGPKLMEIYEKMNSHPRIIFCSNQVDSSEIISVSDMIISFPFTSTTFEALCNNRPAIWHDAAGYYRESIFGKIAGLVTHDYEELKTKITEIMEKTEKGETCIETPDSPYMDPFHDGKAIERFRELLSAS